ncbi:MAG: DUF1697 domain-containing protein [Elusimicrobia bacterium]|nr:DUF1697 domain-containing protein [Elusimicrobiota bacterium]
MNYIALLRGINVGTTKRVEMKKLKAVFEGLGFGGVETYINSGNVRFSAASGAAALGARIRAAIRAELGFDVLTLVKSVREVRAIAAAVPAGWGNNSAQRTDVAYLFPEADSPLTIERLPLNRDYVDVRYVRGALYWNILRKNYAKSRLNKLISHDLYQRMTVRNINTARFLAAWGEGAWS